MLAALPAAAAVALAHRPGTLPRPYSTLPRKLSPSKHTTRIRTSALPFPALGEAMNRLLHSLHRQRVTMLRASIRPAPMAEFSTYYHNPIASHPVPNPRPQLHPRPRGSRTDPRVDQSQLTAEAQTCARACRPVTSGRLARAANGLQALRAGGEDGGGGVVARYRQYLFAMRLACYYAAAWHRGNAGRLWSG